MMLDGMDESCRPIKENPLKKNGNTVGQHYAFSY